MARGDGRLALSVGINAGIVTAWPKASGTISCDAMRNLRRRDLAINFPSGSLAEPLVAEKSTAKHVQQAREVLWVIADLGPRKRPYVADEKTSKGILCEWLTLPCVCEITSQLAELGSCLMVMECWDLSSPGRVISTS